MTASPLLAILLITSSNLSSPSKHLLFHYPPHPNPRPSADEEFLDDSSSDTSSTSSTSSTASVTSLPSSYFSRFTQDKSYPIEADDDHRDGFDRDEDDERLVVRKSRTTEWEEPLFTLSKRDLADILIPKDTLCNRKFELGVEDLVFLGHPVHLLENMERVESLLATSPASSVGNDDGDIDVVLSKVKLSKFHIVFVMNPSWPLDYHEQVQKMYSEIILRFTEACLTEQNERGYISLEAYKIYKVMHDAQDRGITLRFPLI
jgi:hypothetical protein